MDDKKTGLLTYMFVAALSLSMILAIIKILGVPITWYAVMLPLFTYLVIISILMLIGSIAGIVMSIQKNMRG
jgi:hypothetical protein